MPSVGLTDSLSVTKVNSHIQYSKGECHAADLSAQSFESVAV